MYNCGNDICAAIFENVASPSDIINLAVCSKQLFHVWHKSFRAKLLCKHMKVRIDHLSQRVTLRTEDDRSTRWFVRFATTCPDAAELIVEYIGADAMPPTFVLHIAMVFGGEMQSNEKHKMYELLLMKSHVLRNIRAIIGRKAMFIIYYAPQHNITIS